MTDDAHDPLERQEIERIVAALRPLPPVDVAAQARVLVAVQADSLRSTHAHARRRSSLRAGVMGALAAAAIIAAVYRFVENDGSPAITAAVLRGTDATVVIQDGSRREMVHAAAARPGGSPVVAVPLVLSAPSARQVSIVGDFTGWDEHRIAMTRDPVSGLWVASVSVRPGRHVYAFVADDSVWMLDPRAPVASDPDFGRPGSLLLVGRP